MATICAEDFITSDDDGALLKLVGGDIYMYGDNMDMYTRQCEIKSVNTDLL